MPSDSMDDIELKNIQLQFPTARTLSRDDSNTTEEQVMTEKGSILVAIQGDRRKPAIVSFHDIGLNCKLNQSKASYKKVAEKMFFQILQISKHFSTTLT
jgi:hypothetical protein